MAMADLNFDPGYVEPGFQALCDRAPGASVYPYGAFRTEWGPIFHRGRLDGSARLLCIGQDPAQHEALVRRVLVGTAGHRAQGFLAKIGLTRSYVMVNTFLYSVYGQSGGEEHIRDAAIAKYRNAWIERLLAPGSMQAVVAFGGLADQAWKAFLSDPANSQWTKLPYRHVPHPTSPEGAGGTRAQVKTAIKAMLAAWNTAIVALRAVVTRDPDGSADFAPFGSAFLKAELPLVPAFDLPAGTPAWMQGESGWATRSGTTAALKRRTIVVRVPNGVIVPGR
jgi:uracil-DNA glycosylase